MGMKAGADVEIKVMQKQKWRVLIIRRWSLCVWDGGAGGVGNPNRVCLSGACKREGRNKKDANVASLSEKYLRVWETCVSWTGLKDAALRQQPNLEETWRKILKEKYLKECAGHAGVKGLVQEERGERLCQGEGLQRTLETRIQKVIRSHCLHVEWWHNFGRSSASSPSGVLREGNIWTQHSSAVACKWGPSCGWNWGLALHH